MSINLCNSKKGQAYEINEKEHFDNFPPGNKYEFNSLINRFEKYSGKSTSQLTFFDFGCGAGGELIQAQKDLKKSMDLNQIKNCMRVVNQSLLMSLIILMNY